MWFQKEILLSPKKRGFHLITNEIISYIPEIRKISIGVLHLFLQHTSASLTLNENADPDVRIDLETHFNKIAPEHAPHYTHITEGADDMPAHIKTSVLGASLSIPISHGKLLLGTWQGIYFCEHRNYGGHRKLIITLNGETVDRS